MWLTLAMAATRYFAISQVSFRFSFKLAKRVLLAVISVSIMHKTPSFIVSVIYAVENKVITDISTGRILHLHYYRKVFDEVPLNDASYVDIVMNLVGCLLLAVFTGLIISVLVKGKKRHQKIIRSFAQSNSNTWSQTKRTTLTILAITFSTFMCKIVVVVEVICYRHFDYECRVVYYTRLFKKSLQMVNSGMNIVFFIMSKDFRETLIKILCCRNNNQNVNSDKRISSPIASAPPF